MQKEGDLREEREEVIRSDMVRVRFVRSRPGTLVYSCVSTRLERIPFL